MHGPPPAHVFELRRLNGDRKSTRLNSSHVSISYAVSCLKKKNPASTTPLSVAPQPTPLNFTQMTSSTRLCPLLAPHILVWTIGKNTATADMKDSTITRAD